MLVFVFSLQPVCFEVHTVCSGNWYLHLIQGFREEKLPEMFYDDFFVYVWKVWPNTLIVGITQRLTFKNRKQGRVLLEWEGTAGHLGTPTGVPHRVWALTSQLPWFILPPESSLEHAFSVLFLNKQMTTITKSARGVHPSRGFTMHLYFLGNI